MKYSKIKYNMSSKSSRVFLGLAMFLALFNNVISGAVVENFYIDSDDESDVLFTEDIDARIKVLEAAIYYVDVNEINIELCPDVMESLEYLANEDSWIGVVVENFSQIGRIFEIGEMYSKVVGEVTFGIKRIMFPVDCRLSERRRCLSLERLHPFQLFSGEQSKDVVDVLDGYDINRVLVNINKYCNKVEVLNFGKTSLTNDELAHLSQCKRIVDLNLSYFHGGEQGLLEIVDFLRGNFLQLQRLNLSFTSATLQVVEKLNTIDSLKSVKVSGCYQISADEKTVYGLAKRSVSIED